VQECGRGGTARSVACADGTDGVKAFATALARRMSRRECKDAAHRMEFGERVQSRCATFAERCGKR